MSQYLSERILLLSRLGSETIIKRGTYDIDKERPIIQDHPFYAHDNIEDASKATNESATLPSEEEAAELASQILSNNFKTGMSQSDVDKYLSQMGV